MRLSLHLLQICLVYINTLMIQQILSEPEWANSLTAEDLRALTPLVYTHVNPFRLSRSGRLMNFMAVSSSSFWIV